jgi:cell division protein ZapA
MKAIAVKVLNKEFQVNCPTGSEEELFDAARYLDDKIREIRNHGRVIGLERMAIMAALNVTSELLKLREQKESDHRALNDRIKQLQNKIDGVLIEDVALEFE